LIDCWSDAAHDARRSARLLEYARMAVAHCLIAAGALTLIAGFIGFVLQRNALYSTARI
jgi:hypothetical protein